MNELREGADINNQLEEFAKFLEKTSDGRTKWHDTFSYKEEEWEAFIYGWNAGKKHATAKNPEPVEIRKQIGYIEREEGYYALYAPAKGSIVTQAFILCKYCGSAIYHCAGPKSDAVCFKCYEEAPWMNDDDDERTN